MKFFAVIYTMVGILLLFAGIFGAPNVYQFSYVPNPTPIPVPGTPILTGGLTPYSSVAGDLTLWYVIGCLLGGFLFIGQGVMFYTIGEINEKVSAFMQQREKEKRKQPGNR